MRWEPTYVDETPPERITVQTTWEHALEHDLASALTLLFLVAAAAAAALAYLTCHRHGGSTLQKVFADADADEQQHSSRSRRGDEYTRRAPHRGYDWKYD